MSVYFGHYGYVELTRKSGSGSKTSVVNTGDVNVERKRFSFDFDTGFLVTGDRIQIKSTNSSLLSFVSASGWGVGTKQTAGSWYIYVDELGGIRLYSTFDNALEGNLSEAITLESIATNIPIEVTIENDIPNILAQCSYFELNTNREVVDTTALGDEFRTQFSGLITGSGSLKAFWDYLPLQAKLQPGENANYLLQLAIRTEVGSEFFGKFYLKSRNTSGVSSTAPSAYNDEIWYECDAVISQAGVNFNPDNVVEITADFVTTGPIRLRSKTQQVDKVLQEDAGDIRLEQNTAASLLQESMD